MGEFTRVVQQREAAKADAAALRSELDSIRQTKADADNKAASEEVQELRRWKQEREEADVEAKAEAQRSDGRKKIVDSILEGAHPDHIDTLKLMIPGLHESGVIDLYSENPEDAGAKARESLSKKYPQYFGGPDGKQAGHPGSPGIDLSGVKIPTDLDPDTMAKLSDEQFTEMFVTTAKVDFGV